MILETRFLEMDREGEKCESGESPLAQGLRHARREERLRRFLREKEAVGVLSGADVRAVEAAGESFYRQQGVWRDRGDQGPMHSLSEIEAEVGVLRQGYHLMEKELLKLHPHLEEELKALGRTGRSR
jgi:hypothetical protein